MVSYMFWGQAHLLTRESHLVVQKILSALTSERIELKQGSATYDPRAGSGLPSKIMRPADPIQIAYKLKIRSEPYYNYINSQVLTTS